MESGLLIPASISAILPLPFLIGPADKLLRRRPCCTAFVLWLDELHDTSINASTVLIEFATREFA